MIDKVNWGVVNINDILERLNRKSTELNWHIKTDFAEFKEIKFSIDGSKLVYSCMISFADSSSEDLKTTQIFGMYRGMEAWVKLWDVLTDEEKAKISANVLGSLNNQ